MLLKKEEYEACPGYTVRIGSGGKSYRYFIVEKGHVDAEYLDPITAPGSEAVLPQDLCLLNEETRGEISKYHDKIHEGCYFNVPYDLFVKWMQEHKKYHGGFLTFKKNGTCHEILHDCSGCNACKNKI